MRHSLVFLIVLLLSTAARAGEPVGFVREITGHATLRHPDEGGPQDIAKDTPVFGHDILETSGDAHLTLKFADDSTFVLSGKGKFTVDEYVYDPKKPENDKSVFSLMGAAFSYVGGMLDKGPAPNATLKLDFGSIGIRGTKILGALASGSNWIYLETGKITVDNAGGEVILNPGDGTTLDANTAVAPPAPYAFSKEEIAWLQKMVDDPQARSGAAMASNAPPTSRARTASSLAANTAPAAPGAPPSGGGAAGMMDKAEPMQPAAESGPAAASAVPASPAPPSAAALPASPAEAAPPARAEAETTAKIAGKAPASDILLMTPLSPDKLGTHVTADGAGILRIDTQAPATLNLAVADVTAQHLDNGVLYYSVMMKAKGLEGVAYPEMQVHIPGIKGGDFVVRGTDHPLTKDQDWALFQLPFLLKSGAAPDRITLSLVINGHGTVWIKDVQLRK